MGFVSGVVVFVVVWWVALLAVLPFGVERDESPPPGGDAGAPKRARIAAKAAAATVIAVVVWLVIYLLVVYSGFSFRDWAKTL